MKKNLTSIAAGILSVLLTLQATAATFIAPKEVGANLRVDRIPLDADTMSELSNGLALVCQIPAEDSPAHHRRAAAQALALALALDPTNESARKTLTSFINSDQNATPSAESLIQAKELVWQLHSWLSTPEAGGNGPQLAALMGDSMRFLDPDHPLADSLKNSPEAGNWEGWVSGLESFKPENKENPEESDFDPFDDIEENIPQREEKKIPEPKAPQILLTEASIRTFLYEKADASKPPILSPVIVTMKARKAEKGEQGLALEINANAEQNKIRNRIADPILNALTTSPEFKPTAGRIELNAGGKTYSYNSNKDSLTGPGLVLASSALSGNAPVGTVLARLDGNGKLIAPDNFWNILRSMDGEETGRLIVPASAEEYFTSLLTMEQKSFFLRYEVLMASTPADMIALSSSKPSAEHAAAFAQFGEIRKKSAGIATGAYVANRFVLQRLENLSADAPYHLSAKLLSLQGAGDRPRALTREFLAAELLLVIQPVRSVTNFRYRNIKTELLPRMEDIHDKCRDAIDNLDRLTDIRDRDLLEATGDVTTSLRELIRELKKSGDLRERTREIEQARNQLRTRLAALRPVLSEATAETPTESKQR